MRNNKREDLAVRYWSIIVLLALCLTACRGGSVAATGTTAAGARPSQAPPTILIFGPLTVTITTPADETVMHTPQVEVAG
jgi:hypothetical protein